MCIAHLRAYSILASLSHTSSRARGRRPFTTLSCSPAVYSANLQLSIGLPDPRDTSSLPRLKLLLAGVRRVRARDPTHSPRVRLPITLAILTAIKQRWKQATITHNTLMFWVAATACFFGFFRSGEITVPSVAGFDPTVHLTWGDVTADSQTNPTAVCFRLKRSKCDQFGMGVAVYLARTSSPLCPVQLCLRTWHQDKGHFSGMEMADPSQKRHLFMRFARHCLSWTCQPSSSQGTVPDWGCHGCGSGRP